MESVDNLVKLKRPVGDVGRRNGSEEAGLDSLDERFAVFGGDHAVVLHHGRRLLPLPAGGAVRRPSRRAEDFGGEQGVGEAFFFGPDLDLRAFGEEWGLIIVLHSFRVMSSEVEEGRLGVKLR